MKTSRFTPILNGFMALALVGALASCSKEVVEPVSTPVSAERKALSSDVNKPVSEGSAKEAGQRQVQMDVLQARKGISDPGSGGTPGGDAELEPGVKPHPKTLPVSTEEFPDQGRRRKELIRSTL